jgi:hypothetical protein
LETGLCALCQKSKAIVDSHTIMINPDFLGFSDRQIHTPLLCTDCEVILNKGGEAWLRRQALVQKRELVRGKRISAILEVPFSPVSI